MSEFTAAELELLQRIVSERVHKEKAKQQWGRVPKKYGDLQQKLAALASETTQHEGHTQ